MSEPYTVEDALAAMAVAVQAIEQGNPEVARLLLAAIVEAQRRKKKGKPSP